MADSNIKAIYRLTPMQEGILYHTLRRPDERVYFDQYSCRYEQAIDPQRLREAWCGIVQRHDALRTLFSWEGRQKPLQLVRRQVDLPWHDEDWSDLPAADQSARFAAFLDADRARGFVLEQAPLLRVALFRLGADSWRMLWSFHHLVVDGWSARLVLNELAAAYGSSARAPAAPAFETFVRWLEQRDHTAAHSYWRSALDGFAAPTRLVDAGSEATSAGPAGAGATRCEVLDGERWQALQRLAREQRLTFYTMLAGAYAWVLARHAGSDDVVFGTTSHGRPADLHGAESIVGLFINTLPQRIAISSQASLGDYLHAIQAAHLAARQFEQTPLAEIQKWSAVAPGTPLFDTILVVENFAAAGDGGGAALAPSEENYREFSHYPFALLAVPGAELELIAVYDRAKFGDEFVESLLQHVIATLAFMNAGMAQPLKQAPPCSPNEQARLLAPALPPAASTSVRGGIHERIVEVALRTPQAIAVRDERGELSYAELVERAAVLATTLAERGVAAGNSVPVLMARDSEAIVAILAILFAGGAYVPLDTSHPPARIAALLATLAAADGQAGVVVTTSVAAAHVPPPWQALCTDTAPASPAAAAAVVASDADTLAYVMFTSGSTGAAKGVMISHRQLQVATAARSQVYGHDPARFLLLSSLATDSSVAGLFWTLTTGGTLVLPRARAEQDMAGLVARIASEGITHVLCLPSLHALIVEQLGGVALPDLRSVIVAGEACPARLQLEHCRQLPNTALYNEYGPTEATVWATMAELTADGAATRVTIGRPLPHVSTYVVDAQLRPVPLGAEGELLIGGVCIAAGYVGDDPRNVENFIDNPFRAEPDPRLYRTGDRVRQLRDGRFEFLGRIDHQVKVRGFRIEPEEVEAALQQHADVAEAMVFVADRASLAPITDGDMEKLETALTALPDEIVSALLERVEGLTEIEVAAALSDLGAFEQTSTSRAQT